MDNGRSSIIKQLAFLITFQKPSVVAILKKNKIALHNQQEKTIANAIIDNIYDNADLQADLENLRTSNINS